jgi:tRNA (Thr-GGU) A37 N-methylase
MDSIQLEPIAYVANSRTATQDDGWGGMLSRIVLRADIAPEALDGLEDFSHIEVLFYFHKLAARPAPETAKRSHPRDNPDWPALGIFAQRKKQRPNRIGATIARLEQRSGHNLIVSNLDADDGTPVLDIKPVMREFLPQGDVRQPQWASELMLNYWSIPGTS